MHPPGSQRGQQLGCVWRRPGRSEDQQRERTDHHPHGDGDQDVEWRFARGDDAQQHEHDQGRPHGPPPTLTEPGCRHRDECRRRRDRRRRRETGVGDPPATDPMRVVDHAQPVGIAGLDECQHPRRDVHRQDLHAPQAELTTPQQQSPGCEGNDDDDQLSGTDDQPDRPIRQPVEPCDKIGLCATDRVLRNSGKEQPEQEYDQSDDQPNSIARSPLLVAACSEIQSSCRLIDARNGRRNEILPHRGADPINR